MYSSSLMLIGFLFVTWGGGESLNLVMTTVDLSLLPFEMDFLLFFIHRLTRWQDLNCKLYIFHWDAENYEFENANSNGVQRPRTLLSKLIHLPTASLCGHFSSTFWQYHLPTFHVQGIGLCGTIAAGCWFLGCESACPWKEYTITLPARRGSVDKPVCLLAEPQAIKNALQRSESNGIVKMVTSSVLYSEFGIAASWCSLLFLYNFKVVIRKKIHSHPRWIANSFHEAECFLST